LIDKKKRGSTRQLIAGKVLKVGIVENKKGPFNLGGTFSPLKKGGGFWGFLPGVSLLFQEGEHSELRMSREGGFVREGINGPGKNCR